MRVFNNIMCTLAPIGIPSYATALAQLLKAVDTTSKKFMNVTLMPCIKENDIIWRFKDAMKRDS